MDTRKAQLIKLINGELLLIPLEEIKNGFFDFANRDKNCEMIKINPPKINLWVHRKNLGSNCVGDEKIIANPPTEEEISKILNENNGVCFLQVNSSNELSSPSNGRGNRSIVIYLSKPVEVAAVAN